MIDRQIIILRFRLESGDVRRRGTVAPARVCIGGSRDRVFRLLDRPGEGDVRHVVLGAAPAIVVFIGEREGDLVCGRIAAAHLDVFGGEGDRRIRAGSDRGIRPADR